MLDMSADSPRQTVSIIEACTIVGVSRRTIYNWLNAGKLEFVRTAGGAVRIVPESLWRPGKQVESGTA
jgi:excisionase family DNA binding protein